MALGRARRLAMGVQRGREHGASLAAGHGGRSGRWGAIHRNARRDELRVLDVPQVMAPGVVMSGGRGGVDRGRGHGRAVGAGARRRKRRCGHREGGQSCDFRERSDSHGSPRISDAASIPFDAEYYTPPARAARGGKRFSHRRYGAETGFFKGPQIH